MRPRLAIGTGVRVYRRGMTEMMPVIDPSWVPDACTLPTVEQPLRLNEFDDVFRDAVRVSRISPPLVPADRSRRRRCVREMNARAPHLGKLVRGDTSG